MLVGGGDAPLFGGFDKSEILMSTALKKKTAKETFVVSATHCFHHIYICM